MLCSIDFRLFVLDSSFWNESYKFKKILVSYAATVMINSYALKPPTSAGFRMDIVYRSTGDQIASERSLEKVNSINDEETAD